MHYVLQENTFREENHDVLVKTLERAGLSYEIVKVLPFVEDFEFKTDRKDVFCFGAVKMSRLATKYGWNPGSLLNSNHDYRVYSEHYRENLLNWDSSVQRFADPIEHDVFFARPCEDTKTFTGRVFDQTQWKEFRDRHLKSGHSTSLNDDTPIQVSSPKNITKEFRFWIVGEEVVTASLYRMGGWINYSEIVDDGAWEFAQRMVKVFRLADSFVMDICEVNSEYKIIECGCINSAGFYLANMQKLVTALEKRYGNDDIKTNSPIDDDKKRYGKF